MKKLSLIILLFSITGIVSSQSALGEIKLRPEYWQTEMKDKDFDKLKEANAFFVRPKQFKKDYDVSEYEELIKKVWSVTSIQVIDEKDVSKNVKIGNVFIRFKSISIRSGNKTIGLNYFKFGYVKKIKTKKDGKFTWWEDFFGIISFTPDVEARLDMEKMKDSIGGDLIDYRLGYLKNYLQQINEGIKTSTNHDFYDDVDNKSELINLKTQTLYIPENILYRFNALTGKEKERSPEELFEEYTHQVSVVNENELSDMILSADEPFYYLMYHQKNAHKIITLVEGLTGKIIYRRSKNLSYNLKPKDIKEINKSISKK